MNIHNIFDSERATSDINYKKARALTYLAVFRPHKKGEIKIIHTFVSITNQRS